MKRVSVSELKNRLSHFLRLVKRGESVEVLERSVPIARIEAVTAASRSEDHLERLIREGIVTRAKKGPPKVVIGFKPVPCKADVVKMLIEDREER